ncbi:MAG: hypothetical protein RML94_05105 [Bacteroidia bacterium]|nr:hypothetical protein [Bacteroidia bacterium]
MRHAEGASAVRSTEAIAQPAARRPEAQRGTRPKKSNQLLEIIIGITLFDLSVK